MKASSFPVRIPTHRGHSDSRSLLGTPFLHTLRLLLPHIQQGMICPQWTPLSSLPKCSFPHFKYGQTVFKLVLSPVADAIYLESLKILCLLCF